MMTNTDDDDDIVATVLGIVSSIYMVQKKLN